MLIERPDLYCWVTWLAKLMAGDSACQWQAWSYTHYKQPPQRGDALPVSWQIDHTRMLSELLRELGQRGERYHKEVNLKLQWFDPYTRIPVLINGKADCVTDDGECLTVCDCKTGAPKAGHQVQVLLYMFMLSNYTRYRDRQLKGVIRYANAAAVVLDGVPADFLTQFSYFVEMLAKEAPPPASPGQDCRYCRHDQNTCAHWVDEFDGFSDEIPALNY